MTSNTIKTLYFFDKVSKKFIGGFSENCKNLPDADYTEIAPVDANSLFIDGAWQVDPDEVINSLKLKLINLCDSYLESTDWQVIRLADPSSTEALKEGVAQKRALARSLQEGINACTTLEELNNININF